MVASLGREPLSRAHRCECSEMIRGVALPNLCVTQTVLHAFLSRIMALAATSQKESRKRDRACLLLVLALHLPKEATAAWCELRANWGRQFWVHGSCFVWRFYPSRRQTRILRVASFSPCLYHSCRKATTHQLHHRALDMERSGVGQGLRGRGGQSARTQSCRKRRHAYASNHRSFSTFLLVFFAFS